LANHFFKPFRSGLRAVPKSHSRWSARAWAEFVSGLRNHVSGRSEIFTRLLPANDTYNTGSRGSELQS
jgi:hypothetical protein